MRRIAWFSCGAASAVAAKLALDKDPEALVVYCNTIRDEHPDNARFMKDVSRWLGKRVKVIRSKEFKTVEEVFERRRFMSGPHGAVCTTELKKIPRFEFQRGDDIHIFGFTAEEVDRIERFKQNNPELLVEYPLQEHGVNKAECLNRIEEAGIRLPTMYRLGYKNNNCIGCVKATSPSYWMKVRHDFPEVFERRAKQSREIGCRLARVKGERVFLDEIPEEASLFPYVEESISCGPDCGNEP